MPVLLFGNGRSVQPTGGRLRICPLTEQLLEWLDAEGLREEVGALVAWANAEHPELDENELEAHFEKIAGAVDRLSSAVATLARLPKDIAGTSANLRHVSSQLARFYTRIAGCLLVSIDNILQSGMEWVELNAMGEATFSMSGCTGAVQLPPERDRRHARRQPHHHLQSAPNFARIPDQISKFCRARKREGPTALLIASWPPSPRLWIPIPRRGY